MIELKLINSTTGVVDDWVVDWNAIEFSTVYSDEGTVSVSYPVGLSRFSRLVSGHCEGALFLDNVEVDGSRFLTQESRRDDIRPDEVASIQGNTWISRLKEAIVYPPSWPSVEPKEHAFDNKNAGHIMRVLLEAAEARGVEAAVRSTWTFTDSVDSSGTGWSKTATISFNAGTNLYDVLKSLVNLGLCDFTTKGREIYLTNSGELGADRSVGADPVVLRYGRDIADAPVSVSARDLVTVTLVEGEEGVMAEATDSAAISEWGRRESFLQQNSIQDSGTLVAAGQTYIDINDHEREERTHRLEFDVDSPMPFQNYWPSDEIFVDTNGTPTKYKVVQITLSWESDGAFSGGITLNDRFDAWEVQLQRKLEGFTGGAVNNSNLDVEEDQTIPNAPSGLVLDSTWYLTNSGEGLANLQATWNAPTQNTDGSTISDISHYEVNWKYDLDANGAIAISGGTSWTFSPVAPGWTYNVRVRTVDRAGHVSAWTSWSNIVASEDEVAPPVPSTPVMSNYMGVLRIAWDGKDNAFTPGNMPGDFLKVEVHLSTVTGFTPSASTLIDQLVGAGVSVISSLTYDTPYYAKFIAVDRSGNRSAASAQATATPRQVVATDIDGNVIGLDHIQFKDSTNVVPDGSFELPERRAALLPAKSFGGTTVWSFTNSGAAHGTWCIQGNGAINPSTYRGVYLTPADDFGETEMPATPGKPYYLRCAYKGTVGATGGVQFQIRTRNSDGSSSFLSVFGNVADGFYHLMEGQVTLPSNAVTFTVYLQIQNTVTTGTWTFDRCEIRDVVEDIIIKDAAITTAKIANLAVNDAKIGSVSAGKITVGSLTADITVAARIKTANTGARVELNSAGLQAFDGSGNQTVSVAAATGAVDITGQLKSSASGKRVIVNPAGASFPEIRFYPTTGTNYAVIYSDIRSGEPSENELYILASVNAENTARSKSSFRSGFINLTIYDESLSVNNGGHLRLAENLNGTELVAAIGCFANSEVPNGGAVLMRPNYTDVGHIVDSSPANDNKIHFTSGATRMTGRFSKWNNGYDAVFHFRDTFGSSLSSWSRTFTTTMASNPQVWMQIQDENNVACNLSSLTASGYGVTYSGGTSGGSNAHTLGMRTDA